MAERVLYIHFLDPLTTQFGSGYARLGLTFFAINISLYLLIEILIECVDVMAMQGYHENKT
jgi:hypothetical protein